MPSFVPKFAFLVPEIGLRNPPIWGFFQKLALFKKSLSIRFWFDSERFWDVKHYSKGFLKQYSDFSVEIAYFESKKDSGTPQFEIFSKIFFALSQWAFVLVCLYSRVYVGKGWLLVTSRRTNEGFSIFWFKPPFMGLRGQNRILLYIWQNISCNTSKLATFISLNHFMGEISDFGWYLLPGGGQSWKWGWPGWYIFRLGLLTLSNGVETPQFEHFFRNLHFSQSHWAYVFGLIQSSFGVWNLILNLRKPNLALACVLFLPTFLKAVAFFFGWSKSLSFLNLEARGVPLGSPF